MTPIWVRSRLVACALSTAGALGILSGCSVGPPSNAGSSATVSPVPDSAVIHVPAESSQPIAPDEPIRVEASGGYLTDVSVSREGSETGDGLAGSAVDTSEGKMTAWATTEPLGADETYIVAAVAENPAGQETSEELSVRTAPVGGSTTRAAGAEIGDDPEL